MIKSFTVWYDNDKTLVTNDWNAIDQDGVIGIFVKYTDGTSKILMGHDIYWMQDFGDGMIIANDNDRDGLLRRLPWVKHGRWTTDEKMKKMRREMDAMIEKPKEDCGC